MRLYVRINISWNSITTMPRKYVKRTRRPTKRTRKPRKRTGKGYVTKAQVARMIGRRIEDKYDYSGTMEQDVSNQIGAAPYFQNLNWGSIGYITQGVGQGQRLGNRITVKNAVLKGSIVMRDYNSLNNSRELDQIVTLVVFKLKTYLAGTNPTYANTFSRMFQQGSTAGPLTNGVGDHLKRWNKDVFTIKAVRRFKMGYSGTHAGGATGNGLQPVPNNDFKYQQFFRIPLTKFYKKTQIWDDAYGQSDPKNDHLFMMIYCAPADNSFFTSTPIHVTWDWEGTYEDA